MCQRFVERATVECMTEQKWTALKTRESAMARCIEPHEAFEILNGLEVLLILPDKSSLPRLTLLILGERNEHSLQNMQAV